jgi:thiosulfate/3-mercaptopyruvate sulfurtransferase
VLHRTFQAAIGPKLKPLTLGRLMPTDPLFVTSEWLAAHLSDPDLQVIDGSWYLPAQNRNARREFEDGHVPGAIFFDVDAVSDHATDLPHMLLSAEAFGREAGRLGISSDKTLVVYDGAGLFSAPRVWWTLRLFGARAVLLLEGGLPKWNAEGLALEAGPSRAPPAAFAAVQANGRVADLATIRGIVAGRTAQVIDARPAARFKGEAPEPRPGIASGHMPGSVSIPFTELVQDGRLKTPEALNAVFAQSGVDLARPIVTTCGSGVTAAVVSLALASVGKPDTMLYDGAWAEYAREPDSVIEKG